MSVYNVNSWELPNGDSTKAMIQRMNRQEEEDIISSAKTALSTGRATKNQVRDRLNEFMNLWVNGTRQFYLIPDYVKSLDN